MLHFHIFVLKLHINWNKLLNLLKLVFTQLRQKFINTYQNFHTCWLFKTLHLKNSKLRSFFTNISN